MLTQVTKYNKNAINRQLNWRQRQFEMGGLKSGLQAGSTGLEMAAGVIGEIQGIKQKGREYRSQVKTNTVDTGQVGDTDSLLSQYNSFIPLSQVSWKQFTNKGGVGSTIFDSLSNGIKGAQSGLSFGPWGAAVGGVLGIGAGILGNTLAKKQAKVQKRKTNDLITAYNTKAYDVLNTKAENLDNTMLKNQMRQIAAYGGNIHRYAEGGTLSTQGGDFSTGITTINTGGTHEENPNDGVPVGINPQDGAMNTVEEGEFIYNDYVMSNRIEVPDELVDKYSLKRIRVTKNKYRNPTFAEALKQKSEDFGEMPNDSIEKREFDYIFNIFQQSQEAEKQKIEQQEMTEQFANMPYEQQQQLLQEAQMQQQQAQEQQLQEEQMVQQQMQEQQAAEQEAQMMQEQQMQQQIQPEMDPSMVQMAYGGYTHRHDGISGYSGLRRAQPIPFDKVTSSYVPLDLREYTIREYSEVPDYFEHHHIIEKPLIQGSIYNKPTIASQIVQSGSQPILSRAIDRVNRAYEEAAKSSYYHNKPGNTENSRSKFSFYDLAEQAPLLMGAVDYLADTFGLQNKFKGTQGNAIRQSANLINNPRWSYAGQKLGYRPMDQWAPINNANANYAAQRAYTRNAAGNRAAIQNAQMGLAYNQNTNMGQLYSTMQDNNWNRLANIIGENNKLDLSNAELSAKYNEMIQADQARRAQIYQQAAAADDAEWTALSAAKNANKTGFINSLGKYGSNNKGLMMLGALYNSGIFGTGNEAIKNALSHFPAFRDTIQSNTAHSQGGSIRRLRKYLNNK